MGTALNTAYLDKRISSKENSTGRVVEIRERWFVNVTFGASLSVALAASGLPANNALYAAPYDYLRVSSREPELAENGQQWFFEITYSLANEVQTVEGYQLIDLEYGTHELQEDLVQNLGTGAVLLDANGKPFTSTIQVSRSYPYIKINKKQKTLTADSRVDVLALSGSINDSAVTVAGVDIPAHAGKIRITATETPSEEYKWEVSFEVLVRYKTVSNYIDFGGTLQATAAEFGWDEGIVNEGFYVYNGTDLERATEIITLEDGTEETRPSATPVLLDQNGNKLSEGATPIVVRLQTTPEGDWSDLKLNQV